MQYRVSTVSVTNGSNIVTSGGPTAFTTNLQAGDLFCLSLPGIDSPVYEVASVTDDTHFTLTVNYAGTTATNQPYVVVRDFTPNLGLPYPQKGAVETATIIKTAFAIIDAPSVLTATTFFKHSVGLGISAAGTTQGTATALTHDINVVSTVSSGTGVLLPNAIGAEVVVQNSGANALLVYPISGASIDGGTTNAAFSLDVGAKIMFIQLSATAYITLNATYG